MTSHKQIEETAAEWVHRVDAADWSGEDQARLEVWLAQNTAHRVAWLRLESVWQRADRLSATRAAAPPHIAPWARAVPWAAAAAIGMVAVLGAVLWHGTGSRYSTQVGDRQAISLSDGSQVELNTQTTVRTQVDAHARHVWLEKGEAFFDVKPDAKRPFVIHASGHRVVVLGTKFSVRSEQGRLEVAVLEGRVRVEPLQANPRKPPVVVLGGAMLFSKPAGTVVAVNARDKVANALSWRNGILVFDQSTLQDAAEQFNRYNRRQLVVTDPETAQIRIGGSFDATGVDAFARLLHSGFNLRVERRGDEIRVSQPD
jgi:transmembrane sensor